MPDFDTVVIRRALQRLRAKPPAIFGAIGHRFALNAPLAEADALAFERQHGIGLPADYRRFLTEVGNGGAGPYYGVCPLGSFDGAFDSARPWDDSFVGTLAEPFAFHEPWNDLTGYPEETPEGDEDEYDRRYSAFEHSYCNPARMNGAFPICEIGCALRIWLVVTGRETGNVWYDYRADRRGLAPVLLPDGRRATFGAWYMEWLHHALLACAS
jgi:hypothetical protein